MPLRRIVIAPDSFKESLSAADVASAMAEGVRRVSNSIMVDECPVADGGEGTMATLVVARNGRLVGADVIGPLGDTVAARYGLINDDTIAVVELAEASGLALVPAAQRDPMRTTTFGTGQLILEAANGGCREIIVCIGGSATVNGGTGIAQACDWRFLDADNREITEPMCGGLLHRISRVMKPSRQLPRIRVAGDVTNPLCGPNGAAAVYGPQKGATLEQVKLLDEGLAHLARIAGGDPNQSGAGAAGGAGFGMVTFLGATLERGIDLVLDAVGFPEVCRAADLVITGEGRLDAQSLSGKACMGVAAAAARLGVPTIAIVGSTGPGANDCIGRVGLKACHSLADRFGQARALREVRTLIAELTESVVRDMHV